MDRQHRSTIDAELGDLTIGELAAQAGVTAETIRFYEREGVIPEALRRGPGRYRRYARADADRLRFVKRARDLGFSLDEVRELLALAAGDPARPCGEVNVMAKSHLRQVDAKIAQLTALRSELSRLVRACDRDAAIESCSLLEALSRSDDAHTANVSTRVRPNAQSRHDSVQSQAEYSSGDA